MCEYREINVCPQYRCDKYMDRVFDSTNGYYIKDWPLPWVQDMCDLEGKFTWKQVYQKVKTYKMYGFKPKFIWSISAIKDMQPVFHPNFYGMVAKIQGYKFGSYQTNILYTMYKCAQLLEMETDWIPMKLTPLAVSRNDDNWVDVCVIEDFEFIPTPKKRVINFTKKII